MTPINISHVYCILNTRNGKRYVGSTTRVASRKRQHLCELRKQRHPSKVMQDEYTTFGEDAFSFFSLEEVMTFEREELFAREQCWIDLYKPEYNTNELAGNHIPASGLTDEAKERSRQKKIGRKQSPEHIRKRMETMIRNGKQKLKVVSEEQKKHLSEINTGEKNPNWGLKRSNETRKKISDGNARRIRVGFISPEGLEYREVKNLGWFCREHSLNYWCMRDVDSGRSKSHKGWTKLPQ